MIGGWAAAGFVAAGSRSAGPAEFGGLGPRVSAARSARPIRSARPSPAVPASGMGNGGRQSGQSLGWVGGGRFLGDRRPRPRSRRKRAIFAGGGQQGGHVGRRPKGVAVQGKINIPALGREVNRRRDLDAVFRNAVFVQRLEESGKVVDRGMVRVGGAGRQVRRSRRRSGRGLSRSYVAVPEIDPLAGAVEKRARRVGPAGFGGRFPRRPGHRAIQKTAGSWPGFVASAAAGREEKEPDGREQAQDSAIAPGPRSAAAASGPSRRESRRQ